MGLPFWNRYHNLIRETSSRIFLSPHPLLRPYIAHYTVSYGVDPDAASTLTLIPDASGCFVFTRYQDSVCDRVYGATTKTVTVRNTEEDFSVRLFVEFYPGGLFHFTGFSLRGMTDRICSLQDFNSGLYREICGALENAAQLDDLIQTIDVLLLGCLQEKKPPAFFGESVRLLRASEGALSVQELAGLSHYSERHLNRVFHDYLGLSAKQFSKLLRVNRVIQQMQPPGVSLTELAQAAGFYDQPHFIHEFKSVCGITPTQYLEQLSAFYNEPFKL